MCGCVWGVVEFGVRSVECGGGDGGGVGGGGGGGGNGVRCV